LDHKFFALSSFNERFKSLTNQTNRFEEEVVLMKVVSSGVLSGQVFQAIAFG